MIEHPKDYQIVYFIGHKMGYKAKPPFDIIRKGYVYSSLPIKNGRYKVKEIRPYKYGEWTLLSQDMYETRKEAKEVLETRCKR